MIRAIFALLFISALNAQSTPKSTLESNPQITESSAKSTQNVIDSANDSIISPPPQICRILQNLN
ncbi:hypothetical protein [Helicobacter sp. T3_23-1056]